MCIAELHHLLYLSFSLCLSLSLSFSLALHLPLVRAVYCVQQQLKLLEVWSSVMYLSMIVGGLFCGAGNERALGGEPGVPVETHGHPRLVHPTGCSESALSVECATLC